MSYKSTQEVLDAIQGQVEKTLGDSVDVVLQFHGNANQAISNHFGQGSGTNLSAVAFIAMSSGDSQAVSAAGIPVYINETIDVTVITRSRRGDYKEAAARLVEMADALTFDLFEQDYKHQDVKDCIAAHSFVGRRIITATDPNIMACTVTWNIRPMRAS